MPRILYITNQVCGSGGLERVLSLKTSYLVDRLDYQVIILTINQENDAVFYPFNEKIVFYNFRIARYDKASASKQSRFGYIAEYRNVILEVVEESLPDIISVCDDGIKGFFAAYFLRRTNIPIVYERHASKRILSKGSSWRSKFSFFFINIALHFGAKKFDKFVLLTQGNLKEWNLKNTKVIPNPLSFYPNTVAALDNKTVLTVANHGWEKGIDRLLEAWELVHEKHPDWKLKIYGKKRSDNHFEKTIHKNEKHKKVILFFDPVPHIEKQFLNASIYALPSRSEGFGMVLIEAMACGVPCVAFDCPSGPRDIITDQEDGYLVKNGDIQAFSDRICNLIADQKKRKEMGKKARENASRYLPDKIIPEWDRLFKSLFKKNAN